MEIHRPVRPAPIKLTAPRQRREQAGRPPKRKPSPEQPDKQQPGVIDTYA